MRPQAAVVKAGNLGQRVVSATVGVAGKISERFEFSEDGEISGRAERVLQFSNGRDFPVDQVVAENLRIEGGRSHNVRIPTNLLYRSQF